MCLSTCSDRAQQRHRKWQKQRRGTEREPAKGCIMNEYYCVRQLTGNQSSELKLAIGCEVRRRDHLTV